MWVMLWRCALRCIPAPPPPERRPAEVRLKLIPTPKSTHSQNIIYIYIYMHALLRNLAFLAFILGSLASWHAGGCTQMPWCTAAAASAQAQRTCECGDLPSHVPELQSRNSPNIVFHRLAAKPGRMGKGVGLGDGRQPASRFGRREG